MLLWLLNFKFNWLNLRFLLFKRLFSFCNDFVWRRWFRIGMLMIWKLCVFKVLLICWIGFVFFCVLVLMKVFKLIVFLMMFVFFVIFLISMFVFVVERVICFWLLVWFVSYVKILFLFGSWVFRFMLFMLDLLLENESLKLLVMILLLS